MKKLLGLLSVFVLAFLLVGCIFNESEVEVKLTYMSVDINPSAEFIYDQDGVIVSFELLNEEAQVVAGDIDFVGMDYEAALEEYLDAAVETGFIDVDSDDNAVLITVADEDDSTTNEDVVLDEIVEKVEGFFTRNRIRAAVMKNKEMNEGLKASAKDLGVSPGKVHLAKKAMECDPELTLEEGAALPVRELMAKVKEQHKEKQAECTNEQKQEQKMVKEQLQEQVQERVREHKQLAECENAREAANAQNGEGNKQGEGEKNGTGEGCTNPEGPKTPDFKQLNKNLKENKQKVENSYKGRNADRIKEAKGDCKGTPAE